MGITEESGHVHNWKRQNLFLDIPSRTPEETSQDFVGIKMPLTPSPTPTPKRVNFLVSSRSVDAPISHSPGPSRGKSSRRSILPKLGFRYWSTPDIEKASYTAAPESSSLAPLEKSSISRSLSLTKIFTPRIKRPPSSPADQQDL